jgi:hypothetical protein
MYHNVTMVVRSVADPDPSDFSYVLGLHDLDPDPSIIKQK